MKLFKFILTNKMTILSMVLVLLATALGADSAFAMADEVILAPDPNPSGNMDPVAEDNPDGRPAGEAIQVDEQGGKTQLQNNASTATNVRDAGQEAEDYDPDIVNFRKWRFPIETMISNMCTPVKTNSYIRKHWRTGTTNLDAVYNGADIEIVGGQDTTIAIDGNNVKVYNANDSILSIPASLFDNPECLFESSCVFVDGVDGFRRVGNNVEITDGGMVLYVLENKYQDDGKIKFKVLNAPESNQSTCTISSGTILLDGATACSESQIRVPSESYLPETVEAFLQKQNMTCIITDEFNEQDKKTGQKKNDVLSNAMYNFRRKCARSHWLSKKKRFQVSVKELNGQREDVFTQEGILRQVPMLYTHGEDLTDDDMFAITALMFTENSASDSAQVFCGKKQIRRIMKLVNSATHFKDVSKVEVNDYGIRVRNWSDNFGSLEFIYDQTLDDIRYENFMVCLDLKNAVRYYKRNEKTINQDMKKTGENREAQAYNKSIIDCVCLKGYNAVLICPSSVAARASKLGGIQASFESVSALPSGNELTDAAKQKKYYLTADDVENGFKKGTVVEWDADINGWTEFRGIVRAA